ncbi:MAG: hypothetical protein IT369_21640 [Candidatus Latescibacteria bacterium]|nr:hypothetical protein [Candidatus Latescibacterota bacterium]
MGKAAARIRGSLRLVLGLAGLLAGLAGCGDNGGEAQTPYGPADAVRAYRLQTNALIDWVNSLEQEVQHRAVGASGQATAENLAVVYAYAQPLLQDALASFDRIMPPPALESLHRNMRQVMALRLGAYAAVLEGWALQQEQGENTQSAALYQQAEQRLAQANTLIAAVNQELQAVDLALGEGEGRNPVVS